MLKQLLSLMTLPWFSSYLWQVLTNFLQYLMIEIIQSLVLVSLYLLAVHCHWPPSQLLHGFRYCSYVGNSKCIFYRLLLQTPGPHILISSPDLQLQIFISPFYILLTSFRCVWSQIHYLPSQLILFQCPLLTCLCKHMVLFFFFFG